MGIINIKDYIETLKKDGDSYKYTRDKFENDKMEYLHYEINSGFDIVVDVKKMFNYLMDKLDFNNDIDSYMLDYGSFNNSLIGMLVDDILENGEQKKIENNKQENKGQ